MKQLLLLFLLASPGCAQELKVVASTTDMAAIAKEVGGEFISVTTLCRADQDPHQFEILPQHVLAVRHANVYLRIGAGLDFWTDEILSAADNPGLIVVDCSTAIPLLKDAEEEHEHAHGDHPAHEAGNPHYWTGPSNIPALARNVAEGFERANPANAPHYATNFAAFEQRFDSALASWRQTLLSCRGAGIVTYHRSWDYFARDFSLNIVGTIEPQPGVEPTPMGLALLERDIKTRNAQVLLLEPFSSSRIAALLARDTGISVIQASPSVGGDGSSASIIDHFQTLVHEIQMRCLASPREHE